MQILIRLFFSYVGDLSKKKKVVEMEECKSLIYVDYSEFIKIPWEFLNFPDIFIRNSK